jgi:predicted MFS family arabinose efflux permease
MYFKSIKNYFKTAYGGISKPIWLLSAAMFINRCGTMVFPFLSLYLTQYLHFSIADTGKLLIIYGFGALTGSYLGGYLSDKFGHYFVQVGALILAGLMLLVLMFLTNFYALGVGLFVFTALGDTFRPANQSAIAAYSTPENRTRSYTMNRLAINFGWAIGAGIGGFLAFQNYQLLFIVDGITCILAGFFLLFFLKPSKQNYTKEVENEIITDLKLSPYRDGPYLFFIFNTLIFAVSFFMLFSVIPIYFKEIHHLSEIQIGGLETLNGIIIVIFEMVVVFELEKRYKKMNIIAFGLFFTGISYLLFNLFPIGSVVLFSVLFVTFGEMLAMPFMQTTVVARSSLKTRGKYLGLYGMTYSVAQIASPGLGTWVISNYNYKTLWYGLFLACCIGGLGFIALGKRLSKAEK